MERNKDQHSELPCDGFNYHIITHAIEAIPNGMVGLTCEIGLRGGGGSGFIMDALAKGSFPYKVHVAIDPYGDIIYPKREGIEKRAGYTNELRNNHLGKIYLYAQKIGVNFIFFNLDDTEFFKRFSDGVPIYDQKKSILSEFLFVHFDGPHQLKEILTEFIWFNERMKPGATIVFDNIDYYPHEKLETHIFKNGWILLDKTPPRPNGFNKKQIWDPKAAYQKHDK